MKTVKTRAVPLMRWIPKATPAFKEPRHAAPLVDLFERVSCGEEVQATGSIAPRYGKTETVKHAIARHLLLHPEARVGYGTYADRLAGKKSREIRELYKRNGGHVDADASSRNDWRTGVGDGGLWAGGIEGGWTGEGFNLLVVDDPIKDRARAESGLERERIWDWFTNVALLRLEPKGSLIVIHTRWHSDDLIGRLSNAGWPHVKLQAIDSHGRALWPERFPLENLVRRREQVGEYVWASLYQQEPYPRGGRVFQGTFFYDVVPTGLKIKIGIDLAYSTKRYADYSVAVVLGELDDVYYVLEVVRLQVKAPEFIARVQGLRARYGNAQVCWYVSGTEKGTVDMAEAMGLDIDERPAIADKFTRAQPCAAAWNAGKVLLPHEAPWLNEFTTEVISFTGIGDVHDDQVDALGSAFDAVAHTGPRIDPAAMARAHHELAAARARGGPFDVRFPNGSIVSTGGFEHISASFEGVGEPPNRWRTR